MKIKKSIKIPTSTLKIFLGIGIFYSFLQHFARFGLLPKVATKEILVVYDFLYPDDITGVVFSGLILVAVLWAAGVVLKRKSNL